MSDPVADAAAQVRRFADLSRSAARDRDHWIRQMRAAGASLRQIGEAAGLTHGAIAKIIARD